MTIPSRDEIQIEKLDVARIQLERAIQLFDDHEDYISALTLAGAAEELLGKALDANGGMSDHRKLLEAFPRMMAVVSDAPIPEMTEKEVATEVNEARNWLKHYGDGQSIKMDPRNEASWMIARACGNYYHLFGELTEPMKPFGPLVIESDEIGDIFEGLRAVLAEADRRSKRDK